MRVTGIVGKVMEGKGWEQIETWMWLDSWGDIALSRKHDYHQKL